MESATEKIPLFARKVRVKWRGKSSPSIWRQILHGKPHTEQDQVVSHVVYTTKSCSLLATGRLLEIFGNKYPR